MSERVSLREFQARLAERLSSVARQPGESSKLGFVAGERHWLVDLDQVSALTGVSRLTPVPWARPWFLGVVSVRGVLYGCTDLAAFVGAGRTVEPGELRVLLAHPRFGVNAAIRIERALGLRSIAGMQAGAPQADAPAWMRQRWQGGDGQVWNELDMEALVNDPVFLHAGQD